MRGRVNYNENDLDLFARLLLAEARGEGDLGMRMVGTVLMNRLYANCAPDFQNLRTIPHVVYQVVPETGIPHFQPVENLEIWKVRPKPGDIQRARDLAEGRTVARARDDLWFQNPTPGSPVRGPCPGTMPFAPRTVLVDAERNHCFYRGIPGYCPEFYG